MRKDFFCVSTILTILEQRNCSLGELAKHMDVHQSQISAWLKLQDEGVQAAIREYRHRNSKKGTNSAAFRAGNAMLKRYPDSPYKKSAVTAEAAVALVVGSRFDTDKK